MRFSENMKTFLSDSLEKGWGRQGELHQRADQLLLFVGINLVTNIFSVPVRLVKVVLALLVNGNRTNPRVF